MVDGDETKEGPRLKTGRGSNIPNQRKKSVMVSLNFVQLLLTSKSY